MDCARPVLPQESGLAKDRPDCDSSPFPDSRVHDLHQNFVWKDSVTLWEDTLKKNPSNIRALMSLGNAYMKLPDFGKAGGYYKEALRISNQGKRPSFLNGAVYRLGMTYLFEKDLKEAKRLIDLMEGTIESYNVNILKGFYKASIGDPDSAVEIYRKVLPETNQMDTFWCLYADG